MGSPYFWPRFRPTETDYLTDWQWHDDEIGPADVSGFGSREAAVADWACERLLQSLLAERDALAWASALPLLKGTGQGDCGPAVGAAEWQACLERSLQLVESLHTTLGASGAR